jgi:hypothetical protein
MTTLVGQGFAQNSDIKLIMNPSKTDVYLGSDPIALTARVKGKNLSYEWKLLGPGKLEGKGSSVFYILPETIEGESEQALITVTVTDESGEATTESVTFNILAEEKTASKKGMSNTTKIALGAVAVAGLGGGIAVAAGGGGDGDGNGGGDAEYNVVGNWDYCRGSGETWGCGNIVFTGTSTQGTYTRTDEDKYATYYGTYTVNGTQISMTDGDNSTASPEKWDGAFKSATDMEGTWYVISNPAISHTWWACVEGTC